MKYVIEFKHPADERWYNVEGPARETLFYKTKERAEKQMELLKQITDSLYKFRIREEI